MLFFSVIMMYLLSGMEIDLFIPSYPEMRAAFNLSPAAVQLTLSINFVTYCLGSLYAGAIGDKYGTKHTIICGLIVFILGSICCVCADSFTQILIGRALQGLGVSAPAALGYVIIAKQYSDEDQIKPLSVINGGMTCGMAIAPIIGSYINAYYGWRGNFTALLILGTICLLICVLYTPQDKALNNDLKISLKAYKSIIKSKRFWMYTAVVYFFSCAHWVFISMTPILYMEDLGVGIYNFGLYQGAISLTFATISFATPWFLKKYKYKKCINVSMVLTGISMFCTLLISIFVPDHPLLITFLLCLFSGFSTIPDNMLYPKILSAVPNTKSRASAMSTIFKLVTTASAVEVTSFFYNKRFLEISCSIFAVSLSAIFLYTRLPEFKNNLAK